MLAHPVVPRHACTVYKGRRVDVDVEPDAIPLGSHLVIVVHGSAPGTPDQTIEYVTDDDTPDAALDSGLEIARAVIDGHAP